MGRKVSNDAKMGMFVRSARASDWVVKCWRNIMYMYSKLILDY